MKLLVLFVCSVCALAQDKPFRAETRAWLEANQGTAVELWVGFWKKGSGLPSLTWSESVDQALCFGWIDGVRRGVDADRYAIRFTPRRPRSAHRAFEAAARAFVRRDPGRRRCRGHRAGKESGR